ncbi:hypothetical protein [Devosia sp.]|uniref:hypothetical protein n=1 Tax=Devosia sp. TaxID=1871048 RepID=UPI002605512A|nr:hypothetical protein [Devosia sp.]
MTTKAFDTQIGVLVPNVEMEITAAVKELSGSTMMSQRGGNVILKSRKPLDKRILVMDAAIPEGISMYPNRNESPVLHFPISLLNSRPQPIQSRAGELTLPPTSIHREADPGGWCADLARVHRTASRIRHRPCLDPPVDRFAFSPGDGRTAKAGVVLYEDWCHMTAAWEFYNALRADGATLWRRVMRFGPIAGV